MKYYIANNGEPQGPYTPEQLRDFAITPSTMVWNESMPAWTAAGDVPELAAYVTGGAQNPASVPNGGYQSCQAVPPVPNAPQQPYQQQPPYQQPYQQQPYQQGYNEPCPKTWLVESILVTLFCCLPFGIVGIVKASQVESLFRQGNFPAAKKASDDAGKWTKWGFLCGLLVYLIYIIFVVIGVVANR